MSNLTFVNKDTGEVFLLSKDADWELVSDWQEDHIIKFHAKRGIARSMPQQYRVNSAEDNSADEDCIYINDKELFTKTYHVIGKPEFSSSSYYDFWMTLITRLGYKTNAVYIKQVDNGRFIYAHSKEELILLCNTSKTTFYRFYKEAYKNNYIGEFNCEKQGLLFVINPKYALNGNKLLRSIYHLFEESEDASNTNKQTHRRGGGLLG